MKSVTEKTEAFWHRRSVWLEWFTVAWNVVEAGVAITAGWLAGSTALVSFGADSLIEVLSAGGLLRRFREASAGASPDEQEQAERRALVVVAVSFALLAVYVCIDSTHALAYRKPPESSIVGLGLAITSSIVMPGLAYLKQEAGQALGSAALRADANETWVCWYLSLILLAGVGFHIGWGWWWIDSVAAIGMVPVIAWQSWEAWQERQQLAQSS